uniref:RING-type domain-containing protein n=1 Tax=Macrostomum lignano TaxID=282301 RepID=A0A1I8FES0_9PLAT
TTACPPAPRTPWPASALSTGGAVATDFTSSKATPPVGRVSRRKRLFSDSFAASVRGAGGSDGVTGTGSAEAASAHAAVADHRHDDIIDKERSDFNKDFSMEQRLDCDDNFEDDDFDSGEFSNATGFGTSGGGYDSVELAGLGSRWTMPESDTPLRSRQLLAWPLSVPIQQRRCRQSDGVVLVHSDDNNDDKVGQAGAGRSRRRRKRRRTPPHQRRWPRSSQIRQLTNQALSVHTDAALCQKESLRDWLRVNTGDRDRATSVWGRHGSHWTRGGSGCSRGKTGGTAAAQFSSQEPLRAGAAQRQVRGHLAHSEVSGTRLYNGPEQSAPAWPTSREVDIASVWPRCLMSNCCTPSRHGDGAGQRWHAASQGEPLAQRNSSSDWPGRIGADTSLLSLNPASADRVGRGDSCSTRCWRRPPQLALETIRRCRMVAAVVADRGLSSSQSSDALGDNHRRSWAILLVVRVSALDQSCGRLRSCRAAHWPTSTTAGGALVGFDDERPALPQPSGLLLLLRRLLKALASTRKDRRWPARLCRDSPTVAPAANSSRRVDEAFAVAAAVDDDVVEKRGAAELNPVPPRPPQQQEGVQREVTTSQAHRWRSLAQALQQQQLVTAPRLRLGLRCPPNFFIRIDSRASKRFATRTSPKCQRRQQNQRFLPTPDKSIAAPHLVPRSLLCPSASPSVISSRIPASWWRLRFERFQGFAELPVSSTRPAATFPSSSDCRQSQQRRLGSALLDKARLSAQRQGRLRAEQKRRRKRRRLQLHSGGGAGAQLFQCPGKLAHQTDSRSGVNLKLHQPVAAVRCIAESVKNSAQFLVHGAATSASSCCVLIELDTVSASTGSCQAKIAVCLRPLSSRSRRVSVVETSM